MSNASPSANTVLTGADRHSLHSDTELVQRWLRNLKPASRRYGHPMWCIVTEVFCVGSTSAKNICKRHGFDPDYLVKRP